MVLVVRDPATRHSPVNPNPWHGFRVGPQATPIRAMSKLSLREGVREREEGRMEDLGAVHTNKTRT